MNPLMQGTLQPLGEKEEIARKLIRDALSGANKPAIGFSGGRKSVVLLHLVRQESALPLKVFCVRSGDEFESMARFTEKLKRLWRLDLEMTSFPNEHVEADSQLCCRPAVAAALNQLAQTQAIDCVFLGNAFEDPRRIQIMYGISCVNPIFHFSNRDICDYIKKYKLPRCSLYDEGYEKLDCRRCTPEPAAGPGDATAAEEEEKLIKERLKRLGYL
jgi:phosphoadenosine phosphosulfate reductase